MNPMQEYYNAIIGSYIGGTVLCRSHLTNRILITD